MNPFVVIMLISAIHFPDTSIHHADEVVENVYNESVAEGRILFGSIGNMHCVTLDIDGAPEIASVSEKPIEAVCFDYAPSEEDVKNLLKNGFYEALKIRTQVPLSMWDTR